MITRTADFTPTAADLIAANRLSFISSMKTRRFVVRLLLVMAICAAIGGSLAWQDGWAEMLWSALGGATYGLAALAIMLGLTFLLLGRRVRRIYAQQKALHDAVTISWTNEALTVSSRRGRSTIAWTDYHRISSNSRVIVLNQSDALFNFLPTRTLTTEQTEDLLRAAQG